VPCKDDNKKIEYYHRHKKHYQNKFITTHRKEWNDYQNKYKKKKRAEFIEQIKNDVRSMNISEEGSSCFNAAVILFIILFAKIRRNYWIWYNTGILLSDVNTVLRNWESNGIYKNGKIEIEEWQTDLELIIQITLIASVGAGEIKRIGLQTTDNQKGC